MKRSIQPHTSAWLQKVVSYARTHFADGYAAKTYSQEGEDMVLRRIFFGKRTGFYVDVGAHHPMRYSNTYHFYMQGWRGINIEPNPEAIILFRKLRARDINLQYGVAERAGELTYHIFNDPALNSFDLELSRSRQRDRYRIVGKKEVAVERLDVILEAHLPRGAPIDFMSVDVEGLDLAVLRSNNWKKFRPACVLVEALCSSLDAVHTSELHQFITSQGYRLFAKTFNTLIYLENSFNS